MRSLDILIQHIKNDARVIEFKQIEEKILNHPKYQTKYQLFLETQKMLVQSKHYQSKQYQENKKHYEERLNDLKGDPLVHQYLTLQEELNDYLLSITQTIELAINKPFNQD